MSEQQPSSSSGSSNLKSNKNFFPQPFLVGIEEQQPPPPLPSPYQPSEAELRWRAENEDDRDQVEFIVISPEGEGEDLEEAIVNDNRQKAKNFNAEGDPRVIVDPILPLIDPIVRPNPHPQSSMVENTTSHFPPLQRGTYSASIGANFDNNFNNFVGGSEIMPAPSRLPTILRRDPKAAAFLRPQNNFKKNNVHGRDQNGRIAKKKEGRGESGNTQNETAVFAAPTRIRSSFSKLSVMHFDQNNGEMMAPPQEKGEEKGGTKNAPSSSVVSVDDGFQSTTTIIQRAESPTPDSAAATPSSVVPAFYTENVDQFTIKEVEKSPPTISHKDKEEEKKGQCPAEPPLLSSSLSRPSPDDKDEQFEGGVEEDQEGLETAALRGLQLLRAQALSSSSSSLKPSKKKNENQNASPEASLPLPFAPSSKEVFSPFTAQNQTAPPSSLSPPLLQNPPPQTPPPETTKTVEAVVKNADATNACEMPMQMAMEVEKEMEMMPVITAELIDDLLEGEDGEEPDDVDSGGGRDDAGAGELQQNPTEKTEVGAQFEASPPKAQEFWSFFPHTPPCSSQPSISPSATNVDQSASPPPSSSSSHQTPASSQHHQKKKKTSPPPAAAIHFLSSDPLLFNNNSADVAIGQRQFGQLQLSEVSGTSGGVKTRTEENAMEKEEEFSEMGRKETLENEEKGTEKGETFSIPEHRMVELSTNSTPKNDGEDAASDAAVFARRQEEMKKRGKKRHRSSGEHSGATAAESGGEERKLRQSLRLRLSGGKTPTGGGGALLLRKKKPPPVAEKVLAVVDVPIAAALFLPERVEYQDSDAANAVDNHSSASSSEEEEENEIDGFGGSGEEEESDDDDSSQTLYYQLVSPPEVEQPPEVAEEKTTKKRKSAVKKTVDAEEENSSRGKKKKNRKKQQATMSSDGQERGTKTAFDDDPKNETTPQPQQTQKKKRTVAPCAVCGDTVRYNCAVAAKGATPQQQKKKPVCHACQVFFYQCVREGHRDPGDIRCICAGKLALKMDIGSRNDCRACRFRRCTEAQMRPPSKSKADGKSGGGGAKKKAIGPNLDPGEGISLPSTSSQSTSSSLVMGKGEKGKKEKEEEKTKMTRKRRRLPSNSSTSAPVSAVGKAAVAQEESAEKAEKEKKKNFVVKKRRGRPPAAQNIGGDFKKKKN